MGTLAAIRSGSPNIYFKVQILVFVGSLLFFSIFTYSLSSSFQSYGFFCFEIFLSVPVLVANGTIRTVK